MTGRVMLLLVLFGPLVIRTLPALAAKTDQAIRLSTRPRAERRAALLGDWTRNAAAIAAGLSPQARVDLVFTDERGRELAPFIAAELYPRAVWCYDGWEAWRARTPAPFIRDARAVNASAAPPAASDAVVEIDPQLRLVRR